MDHGDAIMLTKEAMAEVDRRQADLDRVRETLDTFSPDQIVLMREVLIGNAKRHVQIVPRKLPAKERSGRGALIKAVQRVIEHHELVTSSAVLSDLQKEEFKFANENPIAAVSAVLGKLHRRGELVMTKKGRGAIPTEFRRVGSRPKTVRATG